MKTSEVLFGKTSEVLFEKTSEVLETSEVSLETSEVSLETSEVSRRSNVRGGGRGPGFGGTTTRHSDLTPLP